MRITCLAWASRTLSLTTGRRFLPRLQVDSSGTLVSGYSCKPRANLFDEVRDREAHKVVVSPSKIGYSFQETAGSVVILSTQ